MNPLIWVEVGLYFEISDSPMFGGKGTIGYMAISTGGVKDIELIDNEYFSLQVQNVAELCEVPIENVCLISKAKYDYEMSDDED